MHPEFPRDAVDALYGIDAVSVEDLGGGEEAKAWRVHDASGGAWCLKWFRRLRPDDLSSRVELMDGLCREGLPFPRVRRTRDGQPAGTLGGRGVTVSAWIDGDPVAALSVETGNAAGRTLARLHGALCRLGWSGRASSKSWEVDRPDQAIGTCRTVRARIAALRTASELDRRIHDALGERIAALSRIGGIRDALPSLTRQGVHGDYTRPNLLFAEGSLVGILDPLGHAGYPAWELGRVAFEPSTVAVRADWLRIALATFAGYRAESGAAASELVAAVRTTLLYNLFSFWGIAERYPGDGEADATGYEEYWLNRQRVAALLLDDLAEIEALVRIG